MKTIFALFISILSLCLSVKASGQEYVLQSKRSSLQWTGKAAFNAYSLTGTINVKNGTIVLSKDEISQLEVLIDMKSIEHEDKKLKSHLKGEDFFEVKTYPTARFKLASTVKIVDGKAVLIGDMTIKKITKKEKIAVTIFQTSSGIKIAFNHALDRTDYGIEYNSPTIFEKLKADAIADDFNLKATLLFEK